MDIHALRREYRSRQLSRADLQADPLEQFQLWLQEAIAADVLEPTAMTLSTCDEQGQPSSRTVLLKGVDSRGFIFFTNYESRKGRELLANPKAALCFFWAPLERQVCLTGTVLRLPREEAENYFITRPPGSRLATWISRQSEVVPDAQKLEQEMQSIQARFPENQIPMPPYWGGFVLNPRAIEFWQGRPSRLHDRFRYRLGTPGQWTIERLAP